MYRVPHLSWLGLDGMGGGGSPLAWATSTTCAHPPRYSLLLLQLIFVVTPYYCFRACRHVGAHWDNILASLLSSQLIFVYYIIYFTLLLFRACRHVGAHWDNILANVAFPLMCFSDEDAELWSDDPHEYIRKVRVHARARVCVCVCM